MRPAATRARTVIKSIRVDSSLEKRLALVSKKRKVTESAYISSVLRRELLVEPLFPDFDGITVERTTFHSAVELVNREAINMLGAEVAKRKVSLWLDLLGLQSQRQSLWIFLGDIAADCWHWFKIGLNYKEETRVILYHQFGMNWSFFLKSFLVEAFALVSEPPPRITVTETLVKVDWNGGEGSEVLEKSARTPRESLIIG